ncbi:MAG: type III-B CRISPR-associated protein Cas10/Cmr2 [Alphaproteobacteria bacterium]|nr:type III-B CRISPR-associated protein Cas10/Cmr2 [Alphaproteobacteria bacterium]
MSDRLLVLLSLGPVKDTITAARRSSDLWYGSRLLSELAQTAASAVLTLGEGRDDLTLVLPSPEAVRAQVADTGPLLAIPNKLQLIAPRALVEVCVDAARAAIGGHLSARFDQVCDEIVGRGGDLAAIAVAVARAQLADLPELTWVAVPLNGDYGDALRQAERLLHARKAHRPFRPPTWGSRARKSSVDGRRESVLRGQHLQAYREEPGLLWRRYRVRWKEHLCGPGLLKRWAPIVLHPEDREGGANMPTTAHFAAWNLRERWSEEGEPLLGELREAFQDYLRDIGGGQRARHGSWDPVLGHHNATLLYEGRLQETLAEAGEEEEGDTARWSCSLEEARRALRRLKRRWSEVFMAAGRPRLPEPGAYYAVLRADGDHMGATLRRLDLSGAQAVAQMLLQFTRRAQEIVSEHHGQIVYAGGDDVLALLPVAEALPAADALRRAFAEQVGRPAQALLSGVPSARPSREEPMAPTLSAGLCIAHYLEPFQDVLEIARRAEAHAKQSLGRDAWVVALHRRSGPPTRIGGKWDEYASFKRLLTLYAREDAALPRGLPYELRALAERLHTVHVAPAEAPAEAERREAINAALPALRSLEAERIFAQKRLHKLLPREDYEALRARVAPERDDPARPAVSRLADELLVARALTLNQEDAA